MRKKAPAYTLLIAEDVRPEVNGKFSVMGIVNEKINLAKDDELGYALHTIAAYAEFELKQSPSSMKISLSDPSGNIITEGIVPVPEENNRRLVMAGKFVNARFNQSGTYIFRVNIDDAEYVKELPVEIS